MFRSSRILALVVLCVAVPLRAAAEETKNLLVLYANSRLLPANIAADRGLRAALENLPGRHVELYSEFLDVPRFRGDPYVETVRAYLREKYRQHPPDVIVVGGDEALGFFLQQRDLFPVAPVVHMGVGRSAIEEFAALPDDVIGTPVDFDTAGTIELALRWRPDARRVVIVTGTGEWDRSWEAEIRSDVQPLAERVEFEFLAGLATAELAARLAKLDARSIVFTPGYFSDGTGRMYKPGEAAGLLARASGAPVFGPYDAFIGTGVTGGLMPEFEEMGRQAGSLVNHLFEGVAPGSLQVPAATPTRAHLDWMQAQRFGIRDEDVAADTMVHFRSPSFWEAYRNLVLAGLAVIALQGALIGALLLERRRRRRTTEALEHSEHRMTLATTAAGLSMWSWDARLDPSRGVLDDVHPSDRPEVEKAAREALARGADLSIEYRVVTPEDSVRWLAVFGRRDEGSQTRLVGVARDVTERKLAELAAERDRNALRHLGRVSMLGQLSAAIAHQLNQPLAAILGNAEAARTLLRREPVDLAELREICDDIVAEDHRAAEVIRHLRALFKHGEMRLEPLDLNHVVSETLELAHTDLLMRHVIAAAHLEPDLPAIPGDRVQLQQLVLNLIVNAADAMGTTDERARELEIRTARNGGAVQLRVSDRGPGIAASDLDRIFEPFWTTKTSGMGIGLAICRSIVEAHGGRVSVANRAGGGAEFAVIVPVADS